MNIPHPYSEAAGYTEEIRRLIRIADTDPAAEKYLNQPYRWNVQSEIERMLCVALARVADDAMIPEVYNDQRLVYIEAAPRVWFRLQTQAQVGQYRVDVMLENDSIRVAVECDGHAFHERTKEQAAHDKRRDRFLQGAGCRVLRFTGSEIFHDADRCAREVLSIAATLARG